MVDEQPGCNCWICDHLFTWHPMWKLKKCKLIKKNIWKVILYYFRICFTVSENIPLFLSLNKVHARLYKVFHSHIISIFFYLSPNRTWNFVTKIFRYWSFHNITGHRTNKVLLMKFEILGLVWHQTRNRPMPLTSSVVWQIMARFRNFYNIKKSQELV